MWVLRVSRGARRAALLAVMLVLSTASAAAADTFTVNTTSDSADSGGCTTASVCSLRDAVAAANGTPGSTIDLPAGHYTLNTGAKPLGQLGLTAATTVSGAGARTTVVDGNGMSRVFDFEPSNQTDTLTLKDLTVTGGSAQLSALSVTDPGDGGGIFSNGGLDLEHVAVTQNTAAMGGGGVMDGTIHSGAPGPATFNAVTIANNTVQGGVANGQGGGAVVATTLTMTNSTIADNKVSNAGINEGGGLVNALQSGPAVSATLVNDTIVGNVASEPIAVPVGDLGGGVSGDQLASQSPLDSVLNATNTIIAGNTADGTEQDCALLGTMNASSANNIGGDSTCGFTDSGSKQTTAIELGSLQNNGGPTDTMAPTSATGPEVDAGTSTGCPSTDQRGVARPQGKGCDIGAVELAPPTAKTGPATAITPSGATISGTAGNPALLDGTATFDYGTDTSYGQTTSAGTVKAGSTAASESATLAGLKPNTTYHYRLSVTTTDGTATGSDATFKTPLEPTTLAVSCSPSSVMLGHAVQCTATVAGHGDPPTSVATGTVKFSSSVRGTAFGSSGRCTLSARGGASECSVPVTVTGATGRRSIDASYGGDQVHSGSAGSTVLTVAVNACLPPTGSLSGTHLGPAQLSLTRAAERKRFHALSTRGREDFDFFCVDHHHGIRVGYAGGRAVLILTSNTYYHLGSVRAGDSLASAQRTLNLYTHFTLGLNTWYLAAGAKAAGVLKVRHGQVQEIGITVLSQTRMTSSARHLFANIP